MMVKKFSDIAASKAEGITLNKNIAKAINDGEDKYKEVGRKILSTAENIANGTFFISSKYGRNIYLHVAPINSDDVLSGILPYKYWITMWEKTKKFGDGLPYRMYDETTAHIADSWADGCGVWRADFLKTFLVPDNDILNLEDGSSIIVPHYMYEDELDKIIYMALTEPAAYEVNGGNVVMKFDVQSAKDATVEIAGITIGKGLLGLSPETPGLQRAMDVLVKMVKKIVDKTMDIDRYRRNTIALLAKTRNNKFAEEDNVINSYYALAQGNPPMSKADGLTEFPMYTFKINRTFRIRTYGPPIEIDVQAKLIQFDDVNGVKDSLGKPITLVNDMTFMEFLEERFHRTINAETMQNVINDAQQSATDGLLGVLQNTGVLNMADKYLSSVVSEAVDKVEDAISNEIADLGKAIDDTVQDKTAEAFLKMERYDAEHGGIVYKYCEVLGTAGEILDQTAYNKTTMSGSSDNTNGVTKTMGDGKTYAEEFYNDGTIIDIFTIGKNIFYLIKEAAGYYVYKNGFKETAFVPTTEKPLNIITSSEYDIAVVSFKGYILIVDSVGTKVISRLFITIDGNTKSQPVITSVDILNASNLLIRVTYDGGSYVCCGNIGRLISTDGIDCKVILTESTTTSFPVVTPIGSSVYIQSKGETLSTYHKVQKSQFINGKITSMPGVTPDLLTFARLSSSKTHKKLVGERYYYTTAEDKMYVIKEDLAVEANDIDAGKVFMGFDDNRAMIINTGTDIDMYRCSTANNKNYYLFGKIRSGTYSHSVWTDINSITNTKNKDSSVSGIVMKGAASTIMDGLSNPSAGISIDSGDILTQVFNVEGITNKIKTDVANASIISSTLGKTITLDYISINKSWFAGKSIDAHYKLYKKIYDKLVSMEAKVIERDTKATYVTQFTLGK